MRPVVDYCRKSDLPELFEKFKKWYAFNPRMVETAYFEWQFRDSPIRLSDQDFDFLILREASGEITGCLGFSAFEFRFNNDVYVGAWTHNWYSSGQRDGGLALLSKFMELAERRFFLRLNDNSKAVFNLLRIPMLTKLPRWWAVVDFKKASSIFQIENISDLDLMVRSETLLRNTKNGKAIWESDRFDSSDDFLPSNSQNIKGFAKRSGSYLNWRYIDIPEHNYRIIRNDNAFAVFRLETIMGTQSSVMRLMEWTFGIEDSEHAVAEIFNIASSNGAVAIDFHCTATAIGQLLETFGFVPQEKTITPMPDLFRPINHSGGYAVAIDLPPHRTLRKIDFESWYITLGDSDIDRIKL